MCHRVVPLTIEEVREALEQRERCGRAIVAQAPQTGQGQPASKGRAPDAFPGAQVPVIVQREDGKLAASLRMWGFPSPDPADGAGRAARPQASPGKLVFNTRLDTALRQLREGHGMWVEAIAQGRCLVPVRAFYEWGPAEVEAAAETNQEASAKEGDGPTGALSRNASKKPGTRPYRFTFPGAAAFLLAGVERDGRLSIVTTTPNAAVAPVHNRMPLVLGRGESDRWLRGTPDALVTLADRDAIKLAAHPK